MSYRPLAHVMPSQGAGLIGSLRAIIQSIFFTAAPHLPKAVTRLSVSIREAGKPSHNKESTTALSRGISAHTRAMAPGASRSAARTTLIKLLNYHWVLLGPANIFKVSYVNKPSPAAKYVVVPPAESCQADCKIARMWACLFWGLQTLVVARAPSKSLRRPHAIDASLTTRLYSRAGRRGDRAK